MKTLQKKYWSQALLWLLFIYATLPVARPVSEFLRGIIPFRITVNTILFFMLIYALAVFFRKVRVRKISTYFLTALLFSIYFSILVVMRIPEEKIHFSEYGLLSFLIFRALRLNFSENRSFLLSLLLTAAFGWLDEGIQHLIPGRYYDLRDIFFNATGGFLGLWATFIVRRETSEKT